MNTSSVVARVIVTAVLVSIPAVTRAEPLPSARPEQVGLSSGRLERIGQLLKADVEKGQIPGTVALVARKGRVAYFESVGFRDKASGAPMSKDAIFRIYSMTKPIASVAAMMLVEEGKVVLTDPVSKFLPSLKSLDVSVQRFDAATGKATYSTVPAEREITVQDLLRHSSGLTYGDTSSNARLKEVYASNGVDWKGLSAAEQVERLAKVPLAYQPGTRWEYGLSTDVVGRVVEAVSGVTLGQFFQERIYVPLKMTDSGFWVPPEKAGRIAQPFTTDPATGKPIELIDVTAPPKNDSGGGGGVSTTMDYARFCQMLLDGGRLDGVRILSRSTVNLMTSDHLGPIAEAGPAPSQGLLGTPGYTFGLGFAVRRAAGVAGVHGSAGDYTWGGFAGTYFWIDPKEELFGILMMQHPGPGRVQYRKLFRQLVYQAIVD
jgi:CubicO group peptidase (beta-lactamase class C family)